MDKKALPVGKLDSEILKKIVFDKITYKRDEVITRPGIGEDCAVVDFGKYECVLSTDPITAAVSDIGRLAIHISCNDIASNGVEPLGILLAVMLPQGTTADDIEHIMADAAHAAELAGVEIIGGHTEITPAVNTPVIVSTALGRAVRGSSASALNMKPGDLIYITKSAGIEGTGIIACDFTDELRSVLSDEEIEEAKSLLDFVSVIPEGIIGGEVGTSGMHDITEGGIFGAVWEVCTVSGNGAKVYPERVPVLPVTRENLYALWYKLFQAHIERLYADVSTAGKHSRDGKTDAGSRNKADLYRRGDRCIARHYCALCRWPQRRNCSARS